tara:strand:- start:81 stop:353 length:273 start_codon:yes stop_codon:yes gene_type:complete
MSRTIVNISDGLNSWDIQQSTGVTNIITDVVIISNDSDGLNSWDIEQSTSETSSTTVVRYINRVLASIFTLSDGNGNTIQDGINNQIITG